MNIIKKFNIILITLYVIALCFVLSEINKVHFSPFQKTVQLDQGTVLDYEEIDDRKFFVANKRLFVTDLNNNIVKIINVIPEEIFNSFCFYLANDNNHIYLYGFSTYNDTLIIKEEGIAQFTKEGNFEKYVYKKSFSREEARQPLTVKDIFCKNDKLYILESKEKNVIINSLDLQNSNNINLTKKVYEKEFSDYISDTRYFDYNDFLCVKLLFNEIYTSKGEKIDFNLISDTEKSELDKFLNEVRHRATPLNIKGLFALNNFLFFVCVLIVVAGIIIVMFTFLKSEKYKKNRITIILFMFIVSSIIFFTNNTVNSVSTNVKKELNSLANMLALSIDDEFENYNQKIFDENNEMILTDDLKNVIRKSISNINEVNLNRSQETPVYFFQYIANTKGDAFALNNINSSLIYGDYYKGEFADEIDEIKKNTKLERNYTIDSRTGRHIIDNVFMYDKERNAVYVVETGVNIDSISAIANDIIINVIIHLVAILVSVWIAIDGWNTYKNDLKEYFAEKDKKSFKARKNITDIYVFICSIVLDFDNVLFVLVIASMFTEASRAKFALLFAIPITLNNIGRGIGGFITSPLVSTFGEKKISILTAITSIPIFIIMAFGCMTKNIYILAGAKFFEGLLLNSIQTTLIDSLPFELEDKEKRYKWIRDMGSSKRNALIISTMVAGIVAQYIGFSAIYILSAIFGIAVVMLSPYIFIENKKYDKKQIKADIKRSIITWNVLLKPKVILYFIFVIIAVIMFQGYNDFLFPLLAKKEEITSGILTDMGVIATICGYAGIEGLLINKKKNNLKIMNAAFMFCGIMIITLIFNKTLVWLFIVLLIISAFSGAILNNKEQALINIIGEYGYDTKDTHKKIYAIIDGLRIIQTPLLNTLCGISVNVCCAIMGLTCLICPNIYEKICKIGNTNNN